MQCVALTLWTLGLDTVDTRTITQNEENKKGRPNQYYICREIGNRNGSSAQTGGKGAETKGWIVLYTISAKQRKNLPQEDTNEIIKSRSPRHINLLNLQIVLRELPYIG